MNPTGRDRIHHILDAADMCAGIVEEGEAAFFDPGPQGAKSRAALTYVVLVVGEAVKHLPTDVTEILPDVPWARIAGMRDRLAHHYWDVDPEILWEAATNGIPDLARRMREM